MLDGVSMSVPVHEDDEVTEYGPLPNISLLTCAFECFFVGLVFVDLLTRPLKTSSHRLVRISGQAIGRKRPTIMGALVLGSPRLSRGCFGTAMTTTRWRNGTAVLDLFFEFGCLLLDVTEASFDSVVRGAFAVEVSNFLVIELKEEY